MRIGDRVTVTGGVKAFGRSGHVSDVISRNVPSGETRFAVLCLVTFGNGDSDRVWCHNLTADDTDDTDDTDDDTETDRATAWGGC